MIPSDPKDDRALVDELFSQLAPVEPSAALRQRVAQIPNEHPRAQVVVLNFRSLYKPTLALVAAGVLGFFSGQSFFELREENAPTLASSAAEEAPAPPAARATATSEKELDEELEGLLVLAAAGDFEAEDWMESWQPTSSTSTPEEETF